MHKGSISLTGDDKYVVIVRICDVVIVVHNSKLWFKSLKNDYSKK